MNRPIQASPQCTLTWRRLKAGASLQFAPAQILTHAHMLTCPQICVWNPKSKICISSDPHTSSPHQRSGIQNSKIQICISSHRHLPKDLESKIKKLHELTSSHMLICLEFWNPKLKICISFDLHTCSPAQRSGIKNLKFALAHSPHMLACWCSLSAQCSAHVLTDLKSQIWNSPLYIYLGAIDWS